MNLRAVEDPRSCRKCGHVRRITDPAPAYACPQCGAVYAKLEALHRAKLESAERDAAEQARAGRLQSVGPRFDRESAARGQPDGPAHMAAHAVYLLMVLPFAVTQVAAIVLACSMRGPQVDPWLNDHFSWQIRTFWCLVALAVVAGLALLVGLAAVSEVALFRTANLWSAGTQAVAAFLAVCALALVIAVYRIGKGWYRLARRVSP